MSMLNEYFSLYHKYTKEYGDKTILLYHVGAFYEVYTKVNKETKEVTDENVLLYKQCANLNLAYKTDDTLLLGFRDYMLDTYLNKILNAEFTAVVYKQDKNEPNTTRSLLAVYSPGSYLKPEDVSGGSTCSASNNSMCIWIHNNGKMLIIGVSTFDVISGTSYIFEAVIEEELTTNKKMIRCHTSYDELERYISSHNPSEVVLVSNLSDDELNSVESYINLQGRKIHRKKEGEDDRVINAEKQIYQKEVIEECLGGVISESIMSDASTLQYSFGIQCYVLLLSFLSSHSPEIITSIREPIFENNNSRMVLANHTLKQLNIVEDGNYTGKLSCVSTFLNNCVTSMGRRLFRYNILNPLTDAEEIVDRYDMIDLMKDTILVEDTKDKEMIYKKVREIIKNVMDIDRLHRQIQLGRVVPSMFYMLSQNLLEIKEVVTFLMNMDDNKSANIQNYFDKYLACTIHSVSQNKRLVDSEIYQLSNIYSICGRLYQMIDDALILEDCKLLNTMDGEKNVFKVGVNKAIDSTVLNLKESWDNFNAIQMFYNMLLHSKEKKSNTKTSSRKAASDQVDVPCYVKIHETEKGGIMLQCTKRRGKLLEEAINIYPKENDMIIVCRRDGSSIKLPKDIKLTSASASSSSSTYNIGNELLSQVCHDIVENKGDLKNLIISEYAGYLNSYKTKLVRDNINLVSAFVANVDFMQNGAYVATKYGYNRPQIDMEEIDSSTKSYVSFEEIRHPLIEHLNGEELYVTNDIGLGVNKKESINSDLMLLYGTNAVGKTSIIRAIGISLIMAQSGLFVPCSKMVYLPYTKLFTRIIGNDNLFKGLSTFAVEMSELRVILSQTNSRSMVLGDELCSGTEHESAVSIFVSGIKELHDKNVTAIFATHLHEIVDYEEITELKRLSMKHLTVRYDPSRDALIYDRKLKEGSGESMYGLEVCKSLNLPDQFLQRAFEIREKYDNKKVTNVNKINTVLDASTSKYNARKIVSICEICKENKGTEVHHLIHQVEANTEGLVKDGKYHKNHPANLVTICEECHKKMHGPDNAKKEMKKQKIVSKTKRIKKSVVITSNL